MLASADSLTSVALKCPPNHVDRRPSLAINSQLRDTTRDVSQFIANKSNSVSDSLFGYAQASTFFPSAPDWGMDGNFISVASSTTDLAAAFPASTKNYSLNSSVQIQDSIPNARLNSQPTHQS